MHDPFASLTTEQAADAITLACLAVMWLLMLYLELRRTWRWERLGVALTIVTACLAFSYTFTTLDLILKADLWIPTVRWITRISLLLSGVFAIVVMRFDDPEDER